MNVTVLVLGIVFSTLGVLGAFGTLRGLRRGEDGAVMALVGVALVLLLGVVFLIGAFMGQTDTGSGSVGGG